MAHFYGTPGSETGDQKFASIARLLSDDWIVYAQPVVTDGQTANPDYLLIHPKKGVYIFEIKDWYIARPISGKEAEVTSITDKQRRIEKSPIEQARNSMFKLKNRIEKDPILQQKDGYHKGKSAVPLAAWGCLPNMKGTPLNNLRHFWGNALLGEDDLRQAYFENNLLDYPSLFKAQLSEIQIDNIRAIIDPSVIAIGPDGKKKGIYSTKQIDLSREPLNQERDNITPIENNNILFPVNEEQDSYSLLKANAPREVGQLVESSHVRLVRGYGGTGKTDVLIMKAQFLSQNYPERKILVTTFNKKIHEYRLSPELEDYENVTVSRIQQIAYQIIQQRFGEIKSPLDCKSLLTRMIENDGHISSLITKYTPEFLAQEFQWMKEMDLITEDLYLDASRQGRGIFKSKRTALTKSQRQEVFEVFSSYNDTLFQIGAKDWADRMQQGLSILEKKEVVIDKYDDILIDEAQHFAPKWIKLLLMLLNENGTLFACEDPHQSVYRAYSWKQKGLPVVGRTSWLRVPYRCTRQIFQAAYALLESNPLAKQLEEDESREVPLLDDPHLRDGQRPSLDIFSTWTEQAEFIKQKIDELIAFGYPPNRIAIFHPQKHRREAFADLREKKVTISEPRAETGMEYDVVFLPYILEVFKERELDDFDEDTAFKINTFYTVMTRARSLLFMTGQTKRVKELESICDYLSIIDHTF